MNRLWRRRYVSLTCVLAASLATNVRGQTQQSDTNTYLISQSGIGGIQMDMTLAEARLSLPQATFERTSDGDGAALIRVTGSPDLEVVLSADEEDPDAPIDWSKRIQSIETRSPRFHTAEGVRVGSLVADIQKVFGPVREIVESEIESRQYVTFEKQPTWLTLRLDYTGVFPSGSRKTTQYKPGARVLSISVSSRRN